ncbi:MAG: RodZ domain-containing protein [Elusimicrobiota bacterium]
MDIGAKLREKRQDLGLSVEDISAKTLISIKYLQALEENRFSDIPTEVMITGFLRNYSSILELKPDELVAEYKKSNTKKIPVPITTIKIKDAPSRKIFKIKIVPAVITICSIMLMFGIIKIISVFIKSPKTEVTAQQPVKKNLLEIQTTENVWIRIKEGENPIFEGILPPNTVKTFESTEQFSLRIGNLSGLTVSLNGMPVELPKGKLVGEIKLP